MGLTTTEWNSTLAECGLSRVYRLDSLRNHSIAVDTFLLIHKAGHALCARDHELTTVQKQSVLHTRVWDAMYKTFHCLMQCGAVIHCVFDGSTPPAKQATVASRQKNNSSGFKINHRLLEFVKSQLLRLGLHVVQARYEADSHIASMYWRGEVQYVLTEDSDHHIYGMKCISRLDTDTRSGVLYHLGELPASFPEKNLLTFYSSIPYRVESKSSPNKKRTDRKDIPFSEAFKTLLARLGPILGLLLMLFTGNDMVPGGIQGFGIKKAVRLLHSYDDISSLVPSPTNPWENILSLLCEDLRVYLPQARQHVPVSEHFANMHKILLCFLYAVVQDSPTVPPRTLLPTTTSAELISWVGSIEFEQTHVSIPPPPLPIVSTEHKSDEDQELARAEIPDYVQLPACPPPICTPAPPTSVFQCPYIGQRGKRCKQQFLCQEDYLKHFDSAHEICHLCWYGDKFDDRSAVRFLNAKVRGLHIREKHQCSSTVKISEDKGTRTLVFSRIKAVKAFSCFLDGCKVEVGSRHDLVRHLTDVHGWSFKITKPDLTFPDYDSVLRYCQDRRVLNHDDCYYSPRSPLNENGTYRSHNLVCSYHASRDDQDAATKQWQERLRRGAPHTTGDTPAVAKEEKDNQAGNKFFPRPNRQSRVSCVKVECPSFVSVKPNPDGSFGVMVYECHTHMKDLKMRIPESVKSKITTRALHGSSAIDSWRSLRQEDASIENRHILEDINNRNRIHHVTLKDVKNILKANGREKWLRHDKEPESCNLMYNYYVSASKKNSKVESPFVYFKLSGVSARSGDGHDSALDTKYKLVKEDTMIVIMTKTQKSILLKRMQSHGNYLPLCLDSTHNTSKKDLYLSTLIVPGSRKQGIKVGFALHSQKNQVHYTALLNIMSDAVPEVKELQPQVCMADCDDTIHNAFKAVFPSIKHSLFCTWHVLRAWQKSAAGLGEDRAKIMKELSSLLYAKISITEFQRDLNAFKEKWAVHTNFLQYLSTHYFPLARVKQWAMAYRDFDHLDVNTNMLLESWHSDLKMNYFGDKHNSRVDRLLHVLLLAEEDQYLKMLVEKDQLRYGTLLRQQKERIDRAAEWCHPEITVITADKEWTVASQATDVEEDESPLCYQVTRLADRCPDPSSCTLWGQMGATLLCLHTHSCSCPDMASSCVCKHILVVNREYPLPVFTGAPDIKQYTDNKLRDEHSFACVKANALGCVYSLMNELESLTDEKLDLHRVLDQVKSASILLDGLKRSASVVVGALQQRTDARVGQRTEEDKQGYFPKKLKKKATRKKQLSVLTTESIPENSTVIPLPSSSTSVADKPKQKSKKRRQTEETPTEPSADPSSALSAGSQPDILNSNKKPKALSTNPISPTAETLPLLSTAPPLSQVLERTRKQKKRAHSEVSEEPQVVASIVDASTDSALIASPLPTASKKSKRKKQTTPELETKSKSNVTATPVATFNPDDTIRAFSLSLETNWIPEARAAQYALHQLTVPVPTFESLVGPQIASSNRPSAPKPLSVLAGLLPSNLPLNPKPRSFMAHNTFTGPASRTAK